MNYDVDYFINKFEAIPDKKWFVGRCHNTDYTKFCALGHCGVQAISRYCGTKESNELNKLFSNNGLYVARVNDGLYNTIELGDSPKERILNALLLIKSDILKEKV